VKFFRGHVGPRGAMISVSVALSQAPAYAARPRLVHRVVCLFTLQLSLVRSYTAW